MLAPAYFSANYKYFDQLLQTVKNKTTVLILVFKEFLQTSISPLISLLYAKGYHYFPFKKFSSHSAKKFRRGTRLCFRNFRVSKNIMPKRGISLFSIENLLSHSTEKLRRGTLLCFTKILVSKKFMDKTGGGGCITIFCQIFSCLTLPKDFVGEPFSVSIISGIERFHASESYVTILCRNFFCFTVPKNFVEEPFWSVFQKMSGSEKVYR